VIARYCTATAGHGRRRDLKQEVTRTDDLVVRPRFSRHVLSVSSEFKSDGRCLSVPVHPPPSGLYPHNDVQSLGKATHLVRGIAKIRCNPWLSLLRRCPDSFQIDVCCIQINFYEARIGCVNEGQRLSEKGHGLDDKRILLIDDVDIGPPRPWVINLTDE
jgi:hypothetical protein